MTMLLLFFIWLCLNATAPSICAQRSISVSRSICASHSICSLRERDEREKDEGHADSSSFSVYYIRYVSNNISLHIIRLICACTKPAVFWWIEAIRLREFSLRSMNWIAQFYNAEGNSCTLGAIHGDSQFMPVRAIHCASHLINSRFAPSLKR